MTFKKSAAENLAAAFLTGNWSRRELVHRGAQACGSKGRWLASLVRRVTAAFGEHEPDVTPDALSTFLLKDLGFRRAWNRGDIEYPIRHYFWITPSMNARPGPPATWNIPNLPTTAMLADWLECTPGKLNWYAGRYYVRGIIQESNYPRYTYEWIKKTSGLRLLEKPIFALKQIQRKILHDILCHVPIHDAVHSYRKGHSISDYVKPHAGKRVVIRMDLRDFFPSIPGSRVHALFRCLGYPRVVARLLTGICTNAIHAGFFETMDMENQSFSKRAKLRQLYGRVHLPQGAPTSPMLSNLCAYRLDVRLSKLAQTLNASYSRYADDLAFSGDRDFEKCYRRFHVAVCRIALEEGFELNTRKTRIMRRGVRQHLAGLVVNVQPNIARREYDRLRAILHNCLHLGPSSQTKSELEMFRQSLTGRIQYVRMINPERGQKLLTIFNGIDWTK